MNKAYRIALFCVVLCGLFLFSGCQSGPKIQPIDSFSPTRTPRPSVTPEPTPEPAAILPVNDSGNTIGARYNAKTGYTRDAVAEGSFEAFLRNLPLKAAGSSVSLHDGSAREENDYDAVVDWGVINNNEQAAGILARIRLEYYYSIQAYDKMVMTMNDGLKFTFSEWSSGKTLRISNDTLKWADGGTESTNRDNFDKYLEMYYKYSSMGSLTRNDLQAVPAENPIRIGDIFAADGDLRYAVIVVDSQTDENGNQSVLLVSGDKPAQELRLWSNPLDSRTPWIDVDTINGRIDAGKEGIALNIDVRYRFKEPASSEE